MRKVFPKNFDANIERGDGCWEWHGGKVRGYGKYYGAWAHRTAYERACGPIPDGLFVLHKCNNPGCVRPDHLFLGTQADNMKDAASKGRMGRHMRKLLPENAYAILWRTAFGETHKKLADEHGVARTTVMDITTRKNWLSLSTTMHD